MHPGELDIDTALVGRLLRRQFSDWAGLPIDPMHPRGTDYALFRLGASLVVRLPRGHADTLRLEKELRWLPRVAPLLPVPAPEPLAVGAPGGGYPLVWAVYGWLEGRPATEDAIGDRGLLARDLAGLLRALRNIDPAGGPPPGEHIAFRGAPLARRDRGARLSIATLADRLDAAAALAVWEEALAAPRWGGAPVWIHGDLDSRNVLVDEHGRLNGVIDFGCLGVGDPACDVTVAWKLLSGESRAAFRAELGVDEATWARSRGWALSQAVIALSYHTLETNAVLVRESERWLAEVLGDDATRSA
jgi:aminoglycoside phosphotransferase (APT) family kinase protein